MSVVIPKIGNTTDDPEGARPYGHEIQFIFHSDLARITLALHRDLHNAHDESNMSKRHRRRYKRLLFFGVLPSPQKGGRGGVGARAAAAAQIRS